MAPSTLVCVVVACEFCVVVALVFCHAQPIDSDCFRRRWQLPTWQRIFYHWLAHWQPVPQGNTAESGPSLYIHAWCVNKQPQKTVAALFLAPCVCSSCTAVTNITLIFAQTQLVRTFWKWDVLSVLNATKHMWRFHLLFSLFHSGGLVSWL